MKKFPVVFDLETKYTFRDYKLHKDLGVSVAALYDYATGETHSFLESELAQLFPFLENASYIVGFNVKSFDLPVLQPYYPGKLLNFSVFDILDDIREKIGKRIALNDVLFGTLGIKKTGHGLMAIDYYKDGEFEKLKKYCCDDVMLTKDLFDFGVKNKQVFYLTEKGKATIPVEWSKYLEEDSGKPDTHLTLPF